MESSLKTVVEEHESIGSARVDYMLGFRRMPEGYALMLNPDDSHFYWVRNDGKESMIHWDKWAVYRGAKADSFCRELVK